MFRVTFLQFLIVFMVLSFTIDLVACQNQRIRPTRSIGTTVTNLLYWGTPATSDPKNSRYKPEAILALEQLPILSNQYYQHSAFHTPANFYGHLYSNRPSNSRHTDFLEHYNFYKDNDQRPWNKYTKYHSAPFQMSTPLIAQPTKVRMSRSKSIMNKFNSYLKKVLPRKRKPSIYQKNNWADDELSGAKRYLNLN